MPLPSLVAGLGWGWLAASLGAAAGSAIVAGIVGGTFGLGYLVTLGIPVALAAYLAYLSRPAASDPTAREWYPPGRLVAGMAIYAGALPTFMLTMVGGTYDTLRPVLAEVLQQFAKRWVPPDGRLTDQALAEQTEWALFLLPAAFAVQWLLLCAANLYLAGRIVRASGRLERDWPDLAAMSYPAGLAVMLLLAVLAANAGGILAVIGTGFVGAFLTAYLFAGLALVHFVSRRRAPWLVWIVYLGLFFFWPFFTPLVVLAGLLESTLGLKRRFSPSTTPT